PEDVAVHPLHALLIARQLQVRVERGVAEIFEQRALIRTVLRQERRDGDGVLAEEPRLPEMPPEPRIRRPSFHQNRAPAVFPPAEVASVGPAESDQNRI